KLADKDYQVYASTRDQQDISALTELMTRYSNITHLNLDVTHMDMCKEVCHEIGLASLDILINNAGIYGKREQNIDTLDFSNLSQVLQTNLYGPLIVTQSLLPCLRQGQEKLIVNITSKMGSITDNTSGGNIPYRTSKAALNAAMKSVSLDLQNEGFHLLLLHPGWVKTDMGGNDALIDTQTSVTGMINIIENRQN